MVLCIYLTYSLVTEEITSVNQWTRQAHCDSGYNRAYAWLCTAFTLTRGAWWHALDPLVLVSAQTLYFTVLEISGFSPFSKVKLP